MKKVDARKFPKTHCATWGKDAHGLPYPKKGIDGGIKPADQTFKESSDINVIVEKAKRTGVLSHINKNAEFYEDLTEFNYEDAKNKIAETNSAFYGLDAETRAKFGNDPGKFINKVGPMSLDEIKKEFPEWAKKETEFPDVVGGKAKEQPSPPADSGSPPDSGGEEPGNENQE